MPVHGRSAKLVAKDIIKRIKSGENLTTSDIVKIHKDYGYSQESSRSLSALKTRSFKEEVAKHKEDLSPFADQLTAKGNMLLKALDNGKISTSTGRDIMYMFDLAHKNKLLAEGRATENIAIHAKIEITTKDEAEKYLQEYFSNNV